MQAQIHNQESNSKQPSEAKKTKQPKYAMISIALTIGAFILFMLASFFDSMAEYAMYLLIAGVALLVASWGIYFFAGKPSSKELDEEKENAITVIGCKGCDIREERAFQTGDFMFKELGACKKCSGASFIKAIYVVSKKKE